MTEHATFCRICAAACGIVVTTDGERVVRVRGDAEHPVSRGYVCSKGRGLPAWHHSPTRLDRPRLRGADCSWDDLLDDLAGRLAGISGSDGADAIALYLATGLAYDSAGQIASAMWLASLGSTSFYTAATVDNAPVLVAAELIAGNAMLNPVWDPTSPGLLLLFGTNPVVSHGYGTTLPDPVRRYREFRGLGGRIWVIDPIRTETAHLADEHIAIRPGGDVAVLAAIVRAQLATAHTVTGVSAADAASLRIAIDRFDVATAAAAAGITSEEVQSLIDDVMRHRGRVAAFCGTGVTMSRDGVLAEWLRWVVLALSGSLDVAGGMRFNRGAVNRPRPGLPRSANRGPRSRPDVPRVAGQIPVVALADEIEAGHVRALVVTGGNLLSAAPDPARMRTALSLLDVLAVVDVAEGPLTELATHVLPATGQLERADLGLSEHVSLRSGLQATRAVVQAVAERRPVWWMLGGLARRGVGTLLGGADPDQLSDEAFLAGIIGHGPLADVDVFAAGPHGVDIPIVHGWVTDLLPDGCWNLAPSLLLDRLAAHVPPVNHTALVLTPRRTMAWSNSVPYATDEHAVVRLHPDDAASVGVVDGAIATLRSASGATQATVAFDAGVRPGVLSMTHGHPGSEPGWLTSSVAGVDPLTAMPLASGVAVEIERA